MNTENKHIYPQPQSGETEHANGYTLAYLEDRAAEYGISLYPDPDQIMVKLENENRNIERSPLYDPATKSDPTLRTAAVFHKAFIKPMYSTASDAFRPTPEDNRRLCEQLFTETGVNVVMSIAQCKTRSPRRTGSPDAKIDFAELEMYSNLATLTSTAQKLGMNLRFTLSDEGTIFPEQNILGIHKSDLDSNRHITDEYFAKRGVTGQIRIQNLLQSVYGPLNSHFDHLHHQRLTEYRDQINFQLAAAAATGNLDGQHKATIEAFVLFDCIPDEELIKSGVDPNIRGIVNSPHDLPNIPEHLLDQVVDLAAHCEAILSLRTDAAQVVSPDDYHKYPEHDPNGRVTAGITRKDSRISLLPHPTRYNGRTVFPMHGLAIYQSGQFRGYQSLSQVGQIPDAEIVYRSQNHKPLFATIP